MNTEIYTHGPWWNGPVVGMDGSIIPVVAIVMTGLLLITIACGMICIGFVKAIRGGGGTKVKRRVDREEAKAFQEMERGFRRMEERIDSLETLLMGRSQQHASDREFS